MNTEKLLRLADLVETIAPEKFTLMYFWCDGHGCAIGHGANAGLFEGLAIVNDSFRVDGEYNPAEAERRVAQQMGISSSDLSFLTEATHYITGLNGTPSPSEVAIRIRLFVEHHDEKVVRELELA